MRPPLSDSRGWPLRSHDILKLFGLPPSSPIPPAYTAAKIIDNVLVMIVPTGALAPDGGPNRRVVAKCPACAKLVCAGHLSQHMKVHK
jgi:hypothetical protein